VDGLAVAPPAGVQAGLDHDVIEQNVGDRSFVANEDAQAAVGVVDDQVLEGAPADAVRAVADADAARSREEGAVGDGDVFAECIRPAPQAGDRDGVVAGLDVAVGNVDVAAGDAVDAVVVRDQEVVADANAADIGDLAVTQGDGPLGSVQQGYVSDRDVPAFFEVNQAARAFSHDHRPVIGENPIGRSLAGVLSRGVFELLGGIVHEGGAVALDGALADDGDVVSVFGVYQAAFAGELQVGFNLFDGFESCPGFEPELHVAAKLDRPADVPPGGDDHCAAAGCGACVNRLADGVGIAGAAVARRPVLDDIERIHALAPQESSTQQET